MLPQEPALTAKKLPSVIGLLCIFRRLESWGLKITPEHEEITPEHEVMLHLGDLVAKLATNCSPVCAST
jgi:hypothetical protein